MKTWNQLLVRHGWLLEEKEPDRFDCSRETAENLAFLQESLTKAKVLFNLRGSELIFHQDSLDEEDWIRVLDFPFRGKNGDYWCRPGLDEPKIQKLDTYMAGVVRQFHRLGFYTPLSCDGHDQRKPFIQFDQRINIDWLIGLLRVFGLPRAPFRRQNGNKFNFPIVRRQLLDLAEQMSFIQPDWLEKGAGFVEEQLLYKELEDLLSIPGASSKEEAIRETVKDKLLPYVDFITEDSAGNLLAEMICRRGNGPTVLLNAHLDTVTDLDPGRRIVKKGKIWTSSEGILGADDRAGVALLIAMARHLNSSDFQGRVKFIVTVEEERGLIGAGQVADHFLWGVDGAIVLDRRGKADIVTSCHGVQRFCSEAYGKFFEKVAREIGLTGWKCTAGGFSDTLVWADHGIESVNLSVGYGYEHTDREYLDVHAAYQTLTLLKAVFQRSIEFRNLLRKLSAC